MADAAERQGWRVVRESADHLAMLTRLATIAGLLDRLITALLDAGPQAPVSG